jgi:DNA topoisomerase-1
MSVEELTFDEAVAMLAEKAAQGPPKKRAARKPASPRVAKKKSATKRNSAAKKTAKD